MEIGCKGINKRDLFTKESVKGGIYKGVNQGKCFTNVLNCIFCSQVPELAWKKSELASTLNLIKYLEHTLFGCYLKLDLCAADSDAPLLPEHVHNHLLVSFELQGFVFLDRYNNIVNSSSQ